MGELEDDKFTIECTARNFSDQDVTYDGVDLSVTTDDVTLGEDGRNYVGGTKNLAIEDYTVVSSADGSGEGVRIQDRIRLLSCKRSGDDKGQSHFRYE